MYECPNCGGNLRFDIPSQQLACKFCDTHVSPYAIQKETDAVEREYYEATVFTCPQCAGEILTTDNEAASFCSFCGASTILSSRIAKEKRPKYIIPFKITKEDCKEAYSKKMKKAFFAPKELRNPEYIDGFRGIYMPYWTYQLTQKGSVSFDGKKSHRSGDYIITDHFDLKGDLDAYYLGYSRDASSGFYDNISEPLAPFDAKQLINFEPTFLSGFYADTGDVDASVYLDDVTELANNSTFDKVCKEPAFSGYNVNSVGNKAKLSFAIPTTCKEADNTMYPVWFLSYRNKDRVAYATVNGQTGKVVADMPIDTGKYIICSLLLALPLFLLLNLFLTVVPKTLLGLSTLLVLVSALAYKSELKSIRVKENNEDDEGVQIKKKALRKANKLQQKVYGMETVKKTGRIKINVGTKRTTGNILSTVIICIVACIWLLPVLVNFGTGFLWPIVIIADCVVCGLGIAEVQKTGGTAPVGFIVSIVMVVIAGLVLLFNPVSDLWYYGGAFLTLLAVLFNIIDVIRNYNRLAMRRLPQFERRGGDHYA
ncbi:MAG: hypothetical protein IJ409_04985 [Lachnospiraceae bacterium]|nr:hypothetical protein [Lachnospiraceae bacterium]